MRKYLYEAKDWPDFNWDLKQVSILLALVRYRQGRLLGRMETLGFDLQGEAVLQNLTMDVLKSSEIEGELLDREQVRSSVARRLGMDAAGLVLSDRGVDGVVEMMLDATQNYGLPLSEERLFGWHAALFPTGYSGRQKIAVDAWRGPEAGPMQVVSGVMGKEMVHFEAPPAEKLEAEMQAYLAWHNDARGLDPVLKAAIGHFWFVTVHPFDDGNGRIARALADMLLARADGTAKRFYSMSAQIRLERKAYYEVLERTQNGVDLDITAWLVWFLECLGRALDVAEENTHGVLVRTRYWDKHGHQTINARQRLVLNRLLDGFEGKLTTSKYAKLAKCSQDTALRDVQDLMAKRMLVRLEGGGRSVAYQVAE